MFDFHIHSCVSFDSSEAPVEIVKSAEIRGLKEICFTDHYDMNGEKNGIHYIFTLEEYSKAYDELISDKLKIRRGVEIGLTLWNKKEVEEFLSERNFDFVLGSVHYVGGVDPYFSEYWEGITFEQAVQKYLIQSLECVKVHDDFDVLGHLNYVYKYSQNRNNNKSTYAHVADIVDEIMKLLIVKGKGMEINTSGVDKIGDFLPSIDYLKRFKELGGEIVTIGSDAHDRARVGQYSNEALDMVKEVFGYVCTFKNRNPVFHKL